MAGPSHSKHVKNKRHRSERVMIMKCDLQMNAFSNGRLTIARDLMGVMISFSSLSLSFSLLRSRSLSHAWTFILSTVHIKHVEF